MPHRVPILVTTTCAMLLAACNATGRTDNAAAEQTWLCSDGEIFAASYDREHDRMSLDYGGVILILDRVPAGSGAKYSNGETTFWSKGDQALIMRGGETLHRDCRIKT